MSVKPPLMIRLNLVSSAGAACVRTGLRGSTSTGAGGDVGSPASLFPSKPPSPKKAAY